MPLAISWTFCVFLYLCFVIQPLMHWANCCKVEVNCSLKNNYQYIVFYHMCFVFVWSCYSAADELIVAFISINHKIHVCNLAYRATHTSTTHLLHPKSDPIHHTLKEITTETVDKRAIMIWDQSRFKMNETIVTAPATDLHWLTLSGENGSQHRKSPYMVVCVCVYERRRKWVWEATSSPVETGWPD